jgi:hypothetical protein
MIQFKTLQRSLVVAVIMCICLCGIVNKYHIKIFTTILTVSAIYGISIVLNDLFHNNHNKTTATV